MATKPYLIFSLQHQRYAIAAEEVKEIFLLPELTPISEAPADIVGLLNFHSVFVPVMHLDLRFGQKVNQCHLTDNVILTASQGLQVGLIVEQVETVVDIDEQYIQADLAYGRERNINQAFISGVINLDDEMIILLNVDNLVRYPDALATLDNPENSVVEESSGKNFYDLYFPQASLQTKEILFQRALQLRRTRDDSESIEVTSIAIVSINGSYYGLDLGVVREFTTIDRVTTIPCCPGHIIGNTNLRGEILTLIDIRQFLNLATNKSQKLPKAVVIEVDEIIAGIAVEEVHDVVEFRHEELKLVPVAIDTTSTASYLRWMADYLEQPLNVIDLPKLLAQGAMTVELAA